MPIVGPPRKPARSTITTSPPRARARRSGPSSGVLRGAAARPAADSPRSGPAPVEGIPERGRDHARRPEPQQKLALTQSQPPNRDQVGEIRYSEKRRRQERQHQRLRTQVPRGKADPAGDSVRRAVSAGRRRRRGSAPPSLRPRAATAQAPAFARRRAFGQPRRTHQPGRAARREVRLRAGTRARRRAGATRRPPGDPWSHRQRTRWRSTRPEPPRRAARGPHNGAGDRDDEQRDACGGHPWKLPRPLVEGPRAGEAGSAAAGPGRRGWAGGPAAGGGPRLGRRGGRPRAGGGAGRRAGPAGPGRRRSAGARPAAPCWQLTRARPAAPCPPAPVPVGMLVSCRSLLRPARRSPLDEQHASDPDRQCSGDRKADPPPEQCHAREKDDDGDDRGERALGIRRENSAPTNAPGTPPMMTAAVERQVKVAGCPVAQGRGADERNCLDQVGTYELRCLELGVERGKRHEHQGAAPDRGDPDDGPAGDTDEHREERPDNQLAAGRRPWVPRHPQAPSPRRARRSGATRDADVDRELIFGLARRADQVCRPAGEEACRHRADAEPEHDSRHRRCLGGHGAHQRRGA